MKKKPDKKLVLATLALLAGVASASLSKGLDAPRASHPDGPKKTLSTGAFRA